MMKKLKSKNNLPESNIGTFMVWTTVSIMSVIVAFIRMQTSLLLVVSGFFSDHEDADRNEAQN